MLHLPNKSKIIFAIFSMLLLFSSIVCADPRFDEIDHIMKDTRSSWMIPGMAVAIVENDQITWMGADGYADVENQVAATPQTLWRIASITKPITATAIMQLVADDKVQLNKSIWTYLPWYPRKGSDVITVLNLLTHTSGIRHYHGSEMDSQQHFDSVAAAAKIYGVDQESLQFTPGTRYLYSSFGYALLAGVIEEASGETFADYLHEHIFTPANMTTACLDQPLAIIEHRSHGYRKDDTGKIKNAPYVDVSYKWAAGGILATVKDLANFAIALDQNKLVNSETQQQMYTPYHLANGSSTGYGIGWGITTDKQNNQWVSHSGGATGGAAFLLRLPKQGLAVIILCNLENPGDLQKVAMKMAHVLETNAAPTKDQTVNQFLN